MMDCLAASRGTRATYFDSELGRIVYAFRQWRGEPFAEESLWLLAELEACFGDREWLMCVVRELLAGLAKERN